MAFQFESVASVPGQAIIVVNGVRCSIRAHDGVVSATVSAVEKPEIKHELSIEMTFSEALGNNPQALPAPKPKVEHTQVSKESLVKKAPDMDITIDVDSSQAVAPKGPESVNVASENFGVSDEVQTQLAKQLRDKPNSNTSGVSKEVEEQLAEQLRKRPDSLPFGLTPQKKEDLDRQLREKLSLADSMRASQAVHEYDEGDDDYEYEDWDEEEDER